MRQLATAFAAYLITQRRVARTTHATYCHDVEEFITFYEKQKFEDYRELLINYREMLHRRGLGARSIARKICALRAFFRFIMQPAYAQGSGVARSASEEQAAPEMEFPANLVELLGSLPRLEYRLPRVCSTDEIAQILATTTKRRRGQRHAQRDALIVHLLYATGLRVSELVQLTPRMMHLPTAMLHIRGKGDKMRHIPLQQELIAKLVEYMHIFNKKHLDRPLFPLSRQTVWRIIKRVARRAGITKSISPHTLRHSLATHSLEQGWDLRALQMLLGHERIATTEVYIHLDTTFVRAEYKKRHPRGGKG